MPSVTIVVTGFAALALSMIAVGFLAAQSGYAEFGQGLVIAGTGLVGVSGAALATKVHPYLGAATGLTSCVFLVAGMVRASFSI